MRFQSTMTLCACLLMTAWSTATGLAQLPSPGRSSVVVAYRLSDWETMHFNDTEKASQHASAVRRLGCETKTSQHGDHTDVSYRLRAWTPLALSNDEIAHRWQAWLDAAGFETLHGHGAAHDDHADHGHRHGTNQDEVVAYRLAAWKTLRFETQEESDQFKAIAQGLGCEFRQDRGDAQRGITVRCRDWKHIDVASHASASSWERWLAGCGFEARHEHGDQHDHAH